MLLGQGPQTIVRTFQGYEINGYTFYTKLQSDKSTTQNSRVTLVVAAQEFSRSGDAWPVIASKSYYGVTEEIWKLIYSPHLSIPLFRCQWVEDRGVKVDNNGFTLVDFNRVGYVDNPFILAKQATQVFYVTDPSDSQWSIILSGKMSWTKKSTTSSKRCLPFVLTRQPRYQQLKNIKKQTT